jgi:hypothetical protein
MKSIFQFDKILLYLFVNKTIIRENNKKNSIIQNQVITKQIIAKQFIIKQ